MLTLQQLKVMTNMQCDINTLMNPNWVGANQAWNRASMIEIVELFDHVGMWKWWKKMSVNLLQGQIELIDVFHFVLSHKVDMCGGDADKAAQEMFEEMGSSDPVVYIDLAKQEGYSISEMDFLTKLDFMTGLFAFKRPSLTLLWDIMKECKIDGDFLYSWYVSKNVLNTFRQHNGYKTGGYIKMWTVDGVEMEDNVAMEALNKTLDFTSPNYPVELYSGLERVYAESKEAE
jgi:hypothetical protein